MKYSRDSKKLINTFGNKYFKDSVNYMPPVKPVIHYDKDHLQIGRIIGNDQIYALDLVKPCRIVILGSTRSGKTFGMRAIIDRLKQIKRDVVYLSDTKGEMDSSIEPVQEKFRDNLLPGEKPVGLKLACLRPTFFSTISKVKNKGTGWYSINFRKLTRGDFFTLMNAGELTPNQRTSLELVFQELTKRFKKDKNLMYSHALIEEIINTNENIDQKQKNSLIFKFKPLEHSNFYIAKFERDLVKLLQEGYLVSIDMQNFDSFGKGNFLFPEVVLNIAMREITNAKRSKILIKKLWYFIDESSRFLGKSTNTVLRTSVMNSVELDSAHDINFAFAYQNMSDVPNRIMKQARYVFIPATADTESIQTVLLDFAITTSQQIAKNDAIRLKRKMMSHKYSWIIADRFADGPKNMLKMVKLLPPLSAHKESDN